MDHDQTDSPHQLHLCGDRGHDPGAIINQVRLVRFYDRLE
jgi:hypothetical protein